MSYLADALEKRLYLSGRCCRTRQQQYLQRECRRDLPPVRTSARSVKGGTITLINCRLVTGATYHESPVRANSLRTGVDRILTLVSVQEEPIEHVHKPGSHLTSSQMDMGRTDLPDEELSRPHCREEVPRSLHLGHEFIEHIRAPVSEDSIPMKEIEVSLRASSMDRIAISKSIMTSAVLG